MSVGRDQAGALLGALSSLIRSTRAAGHRHGGQMGAAGTPVALLKTLLAGDTRPSDLAGTLQVAPSVVSRTIVRLEQAGLVERRPDPADARASLIALTGLGRRQLDQLQQAYVDEVRTVLEGWNDAEAAQAAELMIRLEHAVAQTFTADVQRRLLSEALIPTDADDDAQRTYGPDVVDATVLASTR